MMTISSRMPARPQVDRHLSILLFVAALAVAADDGGAGLLRVFLQEEGGMALRTGFGDGPVPQGELALRIVRAGIERPALLAALLGQVAAVLRALDAERDGLRGLAGRVRRAGDELAEPAGLDYHRRAALLALLVGRGVRFCNDLDGAVRQLLEVLRVLAGRILLVARAGQELPVPAPFDFHHPPA